jgi:hypothetical protein
MTTYRAFYQDDHSKTIFRDAPATSIRRLLPEGARVGVDTRNTIGRLDGGDEFEFALFEVGGRLIVVIPDPRPGKPEDL